MDCFSRASHKTVHWTVFSPLANTQLKLLVPNTPTHCYGGLRPSPFAFYKTNKKTRKKYRRTFCDKEMQADKSLLFVKKTKSKTIGLASTWCEQRDFRLCDLPAGLSTGHSIFALQKHFTLFVAPYSSPFVFCTKK